MHLSPLEIPGIVASVLQHLDSRSLVATAQVNSLWAEEATNVCTVNTSPLLLLPNDILYGL